MENPSTSSDSLDSSKTLDQVTASPDSYTSLMSLCAVDLLDESEAKDSETEGDDELMNLSPIHANSNFDTFDYYWQPTSSEWLAQEPSQSTAVLGAGLANLGNTCFLNAVLQCFIHTVPLLKGILSEMHSASCTCIKTIAGNSGGFCLLCTLRELVELSLTSTNRVVSPYKLVDNLSYFSSSFQRFQQEDAHEFLQCFLDRLESCCEVKKCDNAPSQTDNLVKQVFGGRLVSKLKCSNCGHCSDTYEPSVDLSLEIEDADNLLTALQSFTKVEKIEDSDTKFTCEGCKEQVSIEKQLALDQTPPVASFHLKRFKNEGNFVQKIDKHVAFPKELDLLPFTESENKSDAEIKYILYAVVVHTGLTSTSGHYYCIVRLSPDMWCKFNDSRVSVVSEEFVLSQEAYILFYAKEGTSPWFSSFIETQNLCLTSTILSTSPKSVLDNVETSSYSPELQEKTSVDSNKVSDLSEPKHLGVDNDETKDSERKLNEIDSNKSNDRICNVVEPVNGSSDMSLNEGQKVVSPSLLEKTTWTQETSTVGNINPQTPLRSPSPEIYREDPPDAGFTIPRKHIKLVDRISCKRKLEKEMDDDLETRQACQYIKKSIPGSRGKQLLAAMRGSKSEGYVNKKKSRMGLSQSRNDRNTPTPHRPSVGERLLRSSLIAGRSR